MKAMADQIVTLTGSKSKLEYLPLPPDDPRQRRPDITLAQKQLGWAPTVALAQGLEPTIAYFRKVLSPHSGLQAVSSRIRHRALA